MSPKITVPIELVIPNTGLAGPCFDRTSVPFPKGLIADVEGLRLLEDGVPAPATFGVLQRWDDGSIRWASLDFVIRSEAGVPKRYGVDDAAPVVRVTETDDTIVVDTGVATFELSRRFAGVVSGDGSIGGPYIVDASGSMYRPSRDATLDLISRGPTCVELVGRGWYENERHGTWHRYVVRIRAAAGSTALDIEHQTVLTQDTRGRPIADVGYAIPVRVPQHWFMGIDGVCHTALGKRVYVHQYRHDRVRAVINDDVTTAMTGSHSDGWLGVRQNDGTVASVVLRDVWQRFPKELEFSVGKLIVHTWPKHGMETFTKEEELHPDNVWRLLYAHHGALLDLGMPQDVQDTLNQMNATKKWDVEGGMTVGRAATATSVDVSMTARFAYDVRRYVRDIMPALQGMSRDYLAEPHAVVAAGWLESTRAITFWDDIGFPSSATVSADEMLHDRFLRWLLDWREFADEYGMWIFANGHNTTDQKRTPQMSDDKPDLHRLFQNSHYSQVSLPMMLHLRRPDPRMLMVARDMVRTWMDIGMTPGGQSRHCKSFVPWCLQKHHGTHYLDADTGLFASILDRDARAAELHDAWFRNLMGDRPTPTLGRESINVLAHVLSRYDSTRDPAALDYIRRAIDRFVEHPWDDWDDLLGPGGTTFVMWHVRWLDRAYAITGDPRLVDRAKEFIVANPNHAGLSVAMFLYETTGDKQYLIDAMPRYREWLALPMGISVFWRHFRDALNFASKLRRAGIDDSV